MLIFTNNDCVKAFTNINLVDTDAAFKNAREKIDYIIPPFIKYISGDRTRSRVYGQIKKFYPEELLYMNHNIIDHNIDIITNMDSLIEDSCVLIKDLRIIVLKDKIKLSSPVGYDFITFTRGDNHINTLFIEDKDNIDINIIFNICIKLFDNIITSSLNDINVPVINNYINILYDGHNLLELSKFIVDYLYELLYPFEKSIIVKEEERYSLINQINVMFFSCNAISYKTTDDLLKLIHDTIRGKADDCDYIGFIIKIMDDIENNPSNLP